MGSTHLNGVFQRQSEELYYIHLLVYIYETQVSS